MKRTISALAVLSALLLVPGLTACMPEDLTRLEQQVTVPAAERLDPVQAEVESQKTEAEQIWQALKTLDLTPQQRHNLTALLNEQYPAWEPNVLPSIGIAQVEATLSRHEHKLQYGSQPTSIGLAVVNNTLNQTAQPISQTEPIAHEYAQLRAIGLRPADPAQVKAELALRDQVYPTSIGLAVVDDVLVPEDANRWAQRDNRFREQLETLLTEEQLALFEQHRLQR